MDTGRCKVLVRPPRVDRHTDMIRFIDPNWVIVGVTTALGGGGDGGGLLLVSLPRGLTCPTPDFGQQTSLLTSFHNRLYFILTTHSQPPAEDR